MFLLEFFLNKQHYSIYLAVFLVYATQNPVPAQECQTTKRAIELRFFDTIQIGLDIEQVCLDLDWQRSRELP
ncbi:MAG: hypothetical protein MUE44_04850 [Oscillatoriaceae cyanobacterium Prado104]|jgi:hypothetical protein|nr:hypothetical protein [Oscillatoriaceae cyanobacterium Prado104]